MKRKRKYISAGVLACGFALCMVFFPTVAVFSAQKGISLWANNILPALLPFFICANFLNGIGVVDLVRPSLFPFTMSVLSGYPMGAKIIGDLRRDNRITAQEARRMICFCSTSGPTFMIGAVGVGMLGSARAGMIIAAAHYSAAVLNGFVYSRFLKSDGKTGLVRRKRKMEKGILEIFTESIVASFYSLGMILVYVILFMFLTDLLYMSGALNLFSSPVMKAVAKGFFEMTVGCGAVAECRGLSLAMQTILSTCILSWGGMSIIAQSMSMLGGSGIRMSYFCLTKLTHCLFSAIIALFLTWFML